MSEYKLTLAKREITGKKVKSLRADGLIPSVVYGGKEQILLASEYVPTEKVLLAAGYHSPIDLMIDGKKQLAVVRDVHIDPVTRKIINIEFQAISAREAVVATTPVIIVGFEESEASKTYHFALNQSLDEIDVKAKPVDLPKELEINASGMESIDDKLKLSDIKLPENVEFADKELDMEQVIASLYDPAAEAEKREAEEAAEAAAAAAAAEAEPEAEGEAADTEESTEESKDSAEESAD